MIFPHASILILRPTVLINSGIASKATKTRILTRAFQGSNRGKKVTLLPVDASPSGTYSIQKLVKAAGFTVFVSGVSFVGASIWQYENVRHKLESAWNKARYGFPQDWSSLPIPQKTGEWRQQLNSLWAEQTEGQKVAIGIIAANVLVSICWRIPRFTPAMVKYFCSSPAKDNVCLPMLLSAFSHHSPLHLAANMYVLYSFSTTAAHLLGQEQFLGFYMSAAVGSSFASLAYRTFTKSASHSLGASGALLGILGYVCTQLPHSTLSIIFLPMVTFSAGTAIKAIMALDTAGLIFGWRLFDHAAHLGGVLIGIAYSTWGLEHVWRKREGIMKLWHDLRTYSDPPEP